MSSPWQSGSREQALEALPEIDSLAKEVLTTEKYEETNKVVSMLLKPLKKRKWAHAKLIMEIGYRPTRPLFYLMPLLQGLPRNTRDCIRYLGDYLDLLTKELAFEYLGGNSRQSSLGKNAFRLLKSNLSPEKHDFTLPPGRKHRFTAREVVLTTYVTAVMAKRIKAVSKKARTAVEKDNLYIIGGRWGSKRRVRFAGDE